MATTASKWVQVKTPTDIALNGVNVELDYTNTNIVGVKVTDGAGNVLRITKGDYSEIKVLVPATVEKYRVIGTCCGMAVNKLYDNEADAQDKKGEIDNLDSLGATKVEIEKVMVPE
jgi:hypothetical protein